MSIRIWVKYCTCEMFQEYFTLMECCTCKTISLSVDSDHAELNHFSLRETTVYYNLGFVFVALAMGSVSNDNTVVNEVTLGLTTHDITKIRSNGATTISAQMGSDWV